MPVTKPVRFGTRKRPIRNLAAAMKLPVDEVIRRLRKQGMDFHSSDRLDLAQMHRAREALALRGRRDKSPPAACLSHDELLIRCLRPLREKGKVGRTHTTPIENVWGHGVQGHQKAQARRLVERLLASGELAEKKSQGRRHVWLTKRGTTLLAKIEGRTVE